MAELIRLGAYKTGTNPEVDSADRALSAARSLPAQKKDERATLTEGYAALEKILGWMGRVVDQ